MKGTMAMKSIYIFYITLLLAGSTTADWVAWDHTLTSPPEGWENDPEWVYSSEGVRMCEGATIPYYGVVGYLYSTDVVIPDNCDSIVLYCEQDLTLNSTGFGAASARIYYRLNEETWITIFQGSSGQTTEPIHLQIPVEIGKVLDFRFRGYVDAGTEIHPGTGWIDWLLHDLTLTFYGECCSLEPLTWTGIKDSFE